MDPLPDILVPDLDILFVGLNPGVTSSRSGHHFGFPKNSFWECLYKSGLTDRALTREEDILLPSEYNYGLTNLVERPTISSKGLSRQEMKDAVPSLYAKIASFKPKIACFLGKQLSETILNRKVDFGLQEISIPDCETWIFVCPSTSGLATNLTKVQKIAIFQDLLFCLEFLKSALDTPLAEPQKVHLDFRQA
ncbi:hypothetical protein DSO57_1022586 [Entomophthora muscae]|uniref:Uncharacterized protein n=1 Tax=Entomophthora muscae TaxID=34485 RepID=A0ACC2TEC3_9FUNG|nr:hypothetical protein DSO57_1022586 [Entomophthora muscae]